MPFLLFSVALAVTSRLVCFYLTALSRIDCEPQTYPMAVLLDCLQCLQPAALVEIVLMATGHLAATMPCRGAQLVCLLDDLHSVCLIADAGPSYTEDEADVLLPKRNGNGTPAGSPAV